MKRFVFVLCLLASTAQAGEPRLIRFAAEDEPGSGIRVVGPGVPIAPGAYTKLEVEGLTDEELKLTGIEVNPPDGVFYEPGRTWGGKPFIFFSATKPGIYNVVVTVNKSHQLWRSELERGLNGAKAAKVDDDALVALTAAVEALAASYPVKTGVAVIEVSGPRPPPVVVIPDPVVPPVVESGKRTVVIVRETRDSTFETSQMVKQLRTGTADTYLKSKGHTLAILDDDLPAAQQWVALVKDIDLPAIVITDPSKTGEAALLFRGELPATSADVLKLIQQFGG